MILFVVSTVLLVTVHLLALLISTCILPYMDAVANIDSHSFESPHIKMNFIVEMAWAFSTVLGITHYTFLLWVIFW